MEVTDSVNTAWQCSVADWCAAFTQVTEVECGFEFDVFLEHSTRAAAKAAEKV